MHYVGGWSLEGADGYGQFYEYNADDGTLMSIYKGQFKKSMFNGFCLLYTSPSPRDNR